MSIATAQFKEAHCHGCWEIVLWLFCMRCIRSDSNNKYCIMGKRAWGHWSALVRVQEITNTRLHTLLTHTSKYTHNMLHQRSVNRCQDCSVSCSYIVNAEVGDLWADVFLFLPKNVSGVVSHRHGPLLKFNGSLDRYTTYIWQLSSLFLSLVLSSETMEIVLHLLFQ